MLQTLRANQAILEDFLATQPPEQSLQKAPLACPKYTLSQAFNLINSGAKINFADVDFKVKDARDIANDGHVRRWENPDNYVQQNGELMIPFRFKENHLSEVEQVRDLKKS